MLRLTPLSCSQGGPILALVFRSWGMGAFVFGLGAILLGIRQVRLGENRSERFLGVALLLGEENASVRGPRSYSPKCLEEVFSEVASS